MTNAKLEQLPRLFKLPVEKQVGSLDYDESTDTINCLGWDNITDVETADKKLSKLLEQVHEYEKHYKNKVEIKRLKKMHNDF